MKERVIIVPKDAVSETALNYNEAKPDQLIELYLSESEFNSLYKCGFFSLINGVANVNIDDYEDEAITNFSAIHNVLESINTNITHFNKDVVQSIIRIKELLQEALDRGTGVYFYF